MNTSTHTESSSASSSTGPRILVVGAGATGSVFGAAMIKAGAEVTYYVRERHIARLRNGFPLYHQGFFSVRQETIRDYDVLSTPEEVARRAFDQVWLTTPSDAIREPWLDEFLPAIGNALLVVLQPDPEDVAWIRAHGGKTLNIVQGLIQFSAWQSPLPHEPADQQGMTLLAPPGPSALFDAAAPESSAIAAMLSAGGLRASTRADMPAHAARMSALMIPLIAGLELAGWKLDRYAKHEALQLAIAAAREAISAESTHSGSEESIAFKLFLNRPVTWTLLRLMPWVPGFNAEAFLEYHFTKVDRQTRQMLDTYARHAKQHGLPNTSLVQLRGALPPAKH